MIESLRRFFSEDGFMPHGHCYLWQPGLLWLHIASDALIVLAYFSIPFTLLYFVRKRGDLEFNWMFVCFAVFIVACGATHLMEIWTIWHPAYWLAGGLKVLTALASVPTSILLAKLVPTALQLPSPSTLQRANEQLQREVAERASDIEASFEVLTGNAARTLLRAADTFSADLLVAGACGENQPSMRENALGGTALKLIAQSTRPLLLVRRSVDEPYGHLVLASGEEETTRRVMAALQSFAGDAECHLVHAYDAPFAARLKKLDLSREAIETYGLERFTAAERRLDRLVKESIFADRLRFCVVRGHAGAAVLREIERLEPDLVAVGKHEKSTQGNREHQAGSVSLDIALNTRCDILQVP